MQTILSLSIEILLELPFRYQISLQYEAMTVNQQRWETLHPKSVVTLVAPTHRADVVFDNVRQICEVTSLIANCSKEIYHLVSGILSLLAHLGEEVLWQSLGKVHGRTDDVGSECLECQHLVRRRGHEVLLVFILIGYLTKEVQLRGDIPEIRMSKDRQCIWTISRIVLKHLQDQVVGIELVVV
jgi:hypothetical protein